MISLLATIQIETRKRNDSVLQASENFTIYQWKVKSEYWIGLLWPGLGAPLIILSGVI